VDVITVHQELSDAGISENSGGLAYLNDLAQSVPSAANIGR
jgi:replicative DNA helicase